MPEVRGDLASGRRALGVVLVDEPTGWVGFFRPDVSASVAEILSGVADRFSVETRYGAWKEVVGAGQEQVGFLWGDVGGSTSACGR